MMLSSEVRDPFAEPSKSWTKEQEQIAGHFTRNSDSLTVGTGDERELESQKAFRRSGK
jgi:hypothetical protein